MLGPGPANLSSRVREALARPIMGHLHPEFLQVGANMLDFTSGCQHVRLYKWVPNVRLYIIIASAQALGDYILVHCSLGSATWGLCTSPLQSRVGNWGTLYQSTAVQARALGTMYWSTAVQARALGDFVLVHCSLGSGTGGLIASALAQ